MLKSTIKKIVESQKSELEKQPVGTKRNLLNKIDLNISHVAVISGIRRCGKSTLLRQISKGINNFYYFNFEDPRVFGFSLSDFIKLDEVYHESFQESKYYLFDEIQNVPGWERFVRHMQDLGKKIIITGSNASLLSKELGTKLTGRHLTNELFPFSYSEMLEFIKEKPSLNSFKKYFQDGGFPEYLKFQREEILQEVFRDILLRDIVARYGLRDSKLIQDLAVFLLTNSGKEFSYGKLRDHFNIGSTNSVISYVSYLEESYLLFTVPKFEYSLKKQIVNPKKIYSIDVGLSRANSVSFSEDKGRVLENIVFLGLRRRFPNIYYFREKNECDFLVKEKGKITCAVQVCYDLNEENLERESSGLKDAMKKFSLKSGTIVTMDQEDRLENINVVPAWKWLMSL